MDQLKHVLNEVKAGRMSREEALSQLRSLQGPPGGAKAAVDADAQALSLLITPQWTVEAVPAGSATPAVDQRVLLVGCPLAQEHALRSAYPRATRLDLPSGADIAEIARRVREADPFDHIFWFAPEDTATSPADARLIEAQERGVVGCFRLVKALLECGYGARSLGWTLLTAGTAPIAGERVRPAHAGIHGFAGSLAKEFLNWTVRVVDLSPDANLPVDEIARLPFDRGADVWAWRHGEWYRQRFVGLQMPASATDAYRRGGTYVVVGGAGGIGVALSEYLIRHYDAQIVWIGRRPLDETIEAARTRLGELGPKPLYVRADATDLQQLQAAREEIRARFGAIHGLVHSAIVLLDRSLANMDEVTFRSCLAVKVDASVNLARVFASDALDFVLFFSSLQSVVKAAGQSNYAAGCTFKDAFAHRLSAEWPCRVRLINWGYWGTAGIVASSRFRTQFAQDGVGSIESDEAMAALEALLAGPVEQAGFIRVNADAPLPFGISEELVRSSSEAPSVLPELMDRVERPSIPRNASGPRVIELSKQLESCMARLLLAQLASLGAIDDKPHSCEEYLRRARLHARFDRWLEESFRVLGLRDLVGREPGGFVLRTAPGSVDAAWAEWEKGKAEWSTEPALLTKINLVEAPLRMLPAILRGERLATDALFPSSSVGRVEGIYKGNTTSDYFNDLLASTVVAYVQERLKRDPLARIRIIEIGAGTGGTSGAVLAALDPFAGSIDEYCYTDISRIFLVHGEEHYAPGRPHLKFRLFNVERDVVDEGLANRYDVAIAANVLHATKDIRRTLRNLKPVLKQNGLLLLTEMSGSSLLLHLTFGLLEGWWLYEDEAVRVPGCPALSSEAWSRVLQQEGFGTTHFPAEALHAIGQQTVVSASDGFVRRPIQLSARSVSQPRPVHKPAAPAATPAPAAAAGPAPTPVATPLSVPGTLSLRRHIRDAIVHSLCASLKIEEGSLNHDYSFADYGVDSITGGHVVQLVNRSLSLELPTTTLFDYSSVNKLAAYIEAQHGERIAGAVSAQAAQSVTPAARPAAPAAAPSASAREPIAIIGMSARYPGSRNVDELWEHLRAGDDLVAEVSRWDLGLLDRISGVPRTERCCHGGFLDGIDQFDALFFNIAGVEATYMDPQQRLFLQEAWTALESAGYVGSAIEGRRCGVYVGYNGSDYSQLAQGSTPAQAMWGGSPAILAARIAYHMDLHGPAIAIDTACSSSLVAMHLACQGLWAGETEIAVAGGVFVQSTPSFFLSAGRAGMLSASGRCHTFDDRADGFVPGEGVGVVVLKRLQDAVHHGDTILGVVLGSAINQDGTTNGITAPSALAQERLLRDVYEGFGIDPASVQMMEAHGTATRLGDPIEFDALTRVFRQPGAAPARCALGSIKTNIGHTAAAAGVAGVIKILLSMRHQAIPASLHFESANSHIDLRDSPFFVNTSCRDWIAAPGTKRRAAVSSFGFSGTNGHLVIEEAPDAQTRHEPHANWLITISARSEAALRQQVEQHIRYCEEHAAADCGNVSYTLICGRRHHEHRLACVVVSVAELRERLAHWLKQGSESRIYTGAVHATSKRRQDALEKYGNDCAKACGQASPDERLEKLEVIADLFVQGYDLRLDAMFSSGGYRRVPLPTYPFETRRYWMSSTALEAPARSDDNTGAPKQPLHPLVHENISRLAGQRYRSAFTGREFYLADHVVNGTSILPGVAHLELARAAFEDAAGVDQSEGSAGVTVCISDFVWQRPLEVKAGRLVAEIALEGRDDGSTGIRILERGAEETTSAVCSQGLVRVLDAERSQLNIAVMRRACEGGEKIEGDACYRVLAGMGITLGAAQRGLVSLRTGADEEGRFVLARVELPEQVLDTAGRFVLHPSVMDSAMHASIGFMVGEGDGAQGDKASGALLPFALDEMKVFGATPRKGWACLRESAESTARVRKIDLQICDDEGVVAVSLRGVCSRVQAAAGQEPGEHEPGEPRPAEQENFLAPVWEPTVPPASEQNPLAEGRVWIVGGSAEDRQELLARYPRALSFDDAQDLRSRESEVTDKVDHVIWIAPEGTALDAGTIGDASVITRQSKGVLDCFCVVKQLMQKGLGSSELAFTAVTQIAQPVHADEDIDPTHAGVHGIVGALAKEHARWKVRLVDRPRGNTLRWSQILALPSCSQGNAWAFRDGEWYRQGLVAVEPSELTSDWVRNGGVYVIVGGAGGIGQALSEHLVREHAAQVIWIGRRPEDDPIRAARLRLGELGPAPEYIQCDATQCRELERAREQIHARHGAIHGVVHSAIVLLDQGLMTMEEERFTRALSTKVDVSVNLANVFGADPLDFLLFFSGMQSFGKMAGQSNYAAGCTFKDAFAHQLGRARPSWPVKVLNWGYWGNVGIVASEAHRRRMAHVGIASIEPEHGVRAVRTLLASPFEQLAFIRTTNPQALLGMNLLPQAISRVPLDLPSVVSELGPSTVALPVVPDAGASAASTARMSSLDEMLGRILSAELSELGLNSTAPADWAVRAGVQPLYLRWIKESVRVLGERGLLGGGPIETRDAAWKRWSELKTDWLADEFLKSQIEVVETALKHVSRILRGEIPATEVLFPRGSVDLVEDVYKSNPLADYFNAVLCGQLAAYVRNRVGKNPAARLRILEIGAGTGGTSAPVFETLWPMRDHIAEYCYTDLSRAFLHHAQDNYSARAPYLTCKIFDCEKSPAAQGIECGTFDVVIATNVLHATRDIRETLRNTKALLGRHGLLLLNEVTRHRLLSHLTFGLLEGWWRNVDEALRIPGSPLLSDSGWCAVLRREGFKSVTLPAAASQALGQDVFVAESDGLIRNKVERRSVDAPQVAEVVRAAPSVKIAPPDAHAPDDSRLEQGICGYLKALVARVLRIDADLIEAEAPLERYGIDSILIVRLTDALKEDVPGVTSTLLFEHRSIEELAAHFMARERETFARLTGLRQETRAARTPAAPVAAVPRSRTGRGRGEKIGGAADRVTASSATAPQETARTTADQSTKREPIAIIGLAGRYPEARDLDAFWDNLKNGRDCVREVPPGRWAQDGFFCDGVEEALTQGKSYCKWGGFLEGFAEFDPLFFSMSPREVESVDPQERLFLQSSWDVLENAGYTRERLARQHGGRVGVFVGITKTGFELYGPDLWRIGERGHPRTSFGSVANRVSYFLNLSGPSMPIDTMCSASLTALHEACETLLRNECELAIAGGVNLYAHPSSIVALCALRMVSPTGRCRSFGTQADGMVPGEGVGTVLLKRLSQAEADGDPIHGLILGTSINHGGKTNGYTVPNPAAQRDLVRNALKKAGVSARAVSYIEAHGTGTELGDPIEIAGLTQAFEQDTADRQFCAIGSVKSNIGHAESAAGIAGLTKVLLQMKHGQFAPSLHARELNGNIELGRTPFVVQRELAVWGRPKVSVGGRETEYPRIAGISSFGAGGSNAHVVVQEYLRKEVPETRVQAPNRPALIVLSARDEARLKERAARLVAYLEREALEEGELSSLEYTLQTGREPMEHRLAFTATSLREVRTKLVGYCTGDFAQLHRGGGKSDSSALIAGDEDLQDAIGSWVEKKKYDKLLSFWVRGLAFDWQRLWNEGAPRRLALPGYPFARETFWFSRGAHSESPRSSPEFPKDAAVIHPLVHRNTSVLGEQRYTTLLTGDEACVRDHCVGSARVLAGAAHLEMARAAAADSLGAGEGEVPALCLRHVAWSKPIVVDRALRVHIAIQPTDGEDLRFEIYTEGAATEGNATKVVHSEGTLRPHTAAKSRVDVHQLRSWCADGVRTGEACYEALSAAGMCYGPAHRVIHSLARGTDPSGREIMLAGWSLPDVTKPSASLYGLHPSVVDGALQAALGVFGASAGGPQLPYGIESVQVLGEQPASGWFVVTGSVDTSEALRKVDVQICNEAGEVCTVLSGVTSRPETTVARGSLELLVPRNEPVTSAGRVATDVQRWVLVCTSSEAAEPAGYRQAIEAQIEGVRCEEIRVAASGVSQSFEAAAIELLDKLREIAHARDTKALVQLLLYSAAERDQQLQRALGALLKCAVLESGVIRGQVVDIEGAMSAEAIGSVLDDCAADEQTFDFRYSAAGLEKSRLAPLTVSDTPADFVLPWKDGGVYVVSGGAGALGLHFAEEIARHPKCIVVLLGRSELSAAARRRIDAIPGRRAVYQRVDVSNDAELRQELDLVRREYGAIRGVIHSAGVVRDGFISRATSDDVRTVFASKVAGVVNLDQATANDDLAFFVAFSSLAGVYGGAGQGVYAAANAFMDEYMATRAALAAEGRRKGASLSIAWPLWRDGGMQLDESKAALLRKAGLAPLSVGHGIEAFRRALSGGESKVVVLYRAEPAGTVVLPDSQATPALASSSAPNRATADRDEDLQEHIVHRLTDLLAEALKLPVDRIDADAALETYGIDSLLVLHVTRELEKTFGSLSKTLFFEHQTLRALGSYFVRNHREKLLETAARPAVAPVAEPTRPAVPALRSPRVSRRVLQRSPTPEKSDTSEPIAIIGISGRYPQARNLEELWENLRSGKDCVTEVPESRWEPPRYTDDRGEPLHTPRICGGFVDGVDEFDPLFFNITPLEASFMDPQERLFLESVQDTLEDAGCTRDSLRAVETGRASVGVFVGVMYEEYQLYGAQAQLHGKPMSLSGHPAAIANRVSHFFDFSGPSLAVDTMCSSSLTALHLACNSLRNGECDVAVAGGVNVTVHPNKIVGLGQGQFISRTGRCQSFGAGADGYVPAEGVGSVLLKPLSRAIADGDRIHGLIRGTSINHGGRSNGYTVPNPAAQARAIRQALHMAGVPARAVSYIEAHGTGTSLGDPIEIAGLSSAFAAETQDTGFCAIGSIKSNIGHSESAAGIAGLTKVLLQMKHRLLVPTLHAREPNAHIDFASTPFLIQQELGEWKKPRVTLNGITREYPRIAGISAFGAGGSNAHVVVEEYEPAYAPAPAASQGPVAIVLSARDGERLKERARRLVAALKSDRLADATLTEIAFTLQKGREVFEHRLGVVAASKSEIVQRLERWLAEEARVEGVYQGSVSGNRKVLSVFNSDEDTQHLVDAWLGKRKLGKLLEVWTAGLSVDWSALYRGDVKPRRISLPGYPFARDRYWVDLPKGPAIAMTGGDAPVATRVPYLLHKTWAVAPVGESAAKEMECVILSSPETLSLAERLRDRLGRGTIVDPDALGPEAAQLPLSSASVWIDLVGCGSERPASLGWFTGLQRWVDECTASTPIALCATRGLESSGRDRINLAGASRVGLYRMLHAEYRRVRSGHVDIDPASGEEEVAEHILAEIRAGVPDVEVCYRASVRRIASLQELASESTHSDLSNSADLEFGPHEVLWVTGGTRGIGALTARHFVRRYGVRRVVLGGRVPLPSRDTWESEIQAGGPIAEKIQTVQALEREGAQVWVSAAPLADAERLREELDRIQESLGPVTAIVHSAGAVDWISPAFVRKRAEGVRKVIEPKISALDNLLACSAACTLKCFVLFSSISATVPRLAAGQSDYAMANAYMDYVAEAHAGALPIVSLQWSSWKETGFGEVKSAAFRESGLLSHTNAEGLDLLDRALGQRLRGAVAAAVADPRLWNPARLMVIPPSDRSPGEDSLRRRENRGTRASASLKTEKAGVREATRLWLREMVCTQLKIDADALDDEVPLGEYGADSVMLAQLLTNIGGPLGVALDPSSLLEHPSLEEFGNWLVGTFPEALAASLASKLVPAALTAERVPAPAERAATQPVARTLVAAPVALDRRIAVIGMSCRFPGGDGLSGYWSLLCEGRSAIRPVPPDRGTVRDGSYAALLERISWFDPDYFRIARADAAALDPQARLALEESLNTLCHAGYDASELKGRRIGVYLGARSQHRPDPAALAQAKNPVAAVGQNYVATNVSRFFDLRGPSLVIDSACSSALVAMQMATQALLSGDVDAALVGGVSVLDPDSVLPMFEQRGIAAREPQFHIFDRRARGALYGEGAGMVFLKSLDRARRDGDTIYAVIEALAVNNDGRTGGPTTPNMQAQRAVMEEALQRSGLAPDAVSHIDVNGSGSEVSDLLELKAIESVYRKDSRVPCSLGSMKPNIGHPLCSEGIASFIKVALMLHHGRQVPFLSAEQPPAHYDLQASPFRFVREVTEWNGNERAAAVNCFADGGTNAHVILRAASAELNQHATRRPIEPPKLDRIDVAAQAGAVPEPAATPPRSGFWGRYARSPVAGDIHS